MEKILVTGARGFIGRNLVNALKVKDEVIGCGRTAPDKIEGYRFLQWDVGAEPEPIEYAGENIGIIIHAAASLEKDNLSEELIKTNCIGTLNVLRFAVSHSVKKVIYISGLPIVGDDHEKPIKEDAVLNPQTLYHATKAAGEMIIRQGNHYGIKTVCLRVPSPIGPGMPRKTIVPVFIQQALEGMDIRILGKGTRKQNYLDVRDFKYAIERIIQSDDADGIYNVGSENIVSNYELARLCIEVLGSRSKILLSGIDASDDVDWTADDTRLKNVIGEYQRIRLQQSILDIANEINQA